MSVLARVAFVVTLAWAIVMGGLVPGFIVSLAYGGAAGIVAGLIGGSLGYLVHRFAWAE